MSNQDDLFLALPSRSKLSVNQMVVTAPPGLQPTRARWTANTSWPKQGSTGEIIIVSGSIEDPGDKILFCLDEGKADCFCEEGDFERL